MTARIQFFAFLFAIAAGALANPSVNSAQEESKAAAAKPSIKQEKTKQPTPQEELQRTIDAAGNDRAALVRNLEAYLTKYPESQQRVQIYRALVEACLQLRDNARAADYAERIVALSP